MNILILSVMICLGFCLGSFIHCAISRFLPDQTMIQYFKEIIFSRSKCPTCHKKLDILSLIPIFSWLKQRGRCKYCLAIIPIDYLITELIVSIYCLGITYCYNLTVWSIILIFVGLYYALLAIIDFKYLLLPNYLTYPLLLIGLLFAYFDVGLITFYDALFGAIYGYTLLSIPAAVYYLIKKRAGLGGGDIKLLAALGTWLPVTELVNLLLYASIVGITYFIIYKAIVRPIEKNILVPFGSCLLICAYLRLLILSFN